MAKGQRDSIKERRWRGHLAAWRRSGQSVRSFCAAQGLSEPSFYSWRRVLTRPECRRGVKAVVGNGTASTAEFTGPSPFVPVRLVENPAPACRPGGGLVNNTNGTR